MKYERSLPFCRFLTILMSAIVGVTTVASAFAEDALTQGKRFLLKGQVEKAVPLFYKAAADGSGDPSVSLYLGVCYIRLGKYGEAERHLLEGKSKDREHLYLYHYNLGNIYFLQGRFEEAEQAYTAALEVRRGYPQAVLNRANTYIKLENYAKALKDYTFYLNLEPTTSQREAIERMVLLLELEHREAVTVQTHQSVQNLAKDAEQHEAHMRYQKLQDEINAQLQSVDRASSFSVGSETTLDYSEEYSIE